MPTKRINKAKNKPSVKPPVTPAKPGGPRPTHDPVGGSYSNPNTHEYPAGAAKPEPPVPPPFLPGEKFAMARDKPRQPRGSGIPPWKPKKPRGPIVDYFNSGGKSLIKSSKIKSINLKHG